MVQRWGINYVKVFDVEQNKLVKKFSIEPVQQNHEVESTTESELVNKYRIYDSGISFDQKYAILCVGVFNKENRDNLDANRSSLKGFKIPKHGTK